jgi:hypothetical protein
MFTSKCLRFKYLILKSLREFDQYVLNLCAILVMASISKNLNNFPLKYKRRRAPTKVGTGRDRS